MKQIFKGSLLLLAIFSIEQNSIGQVNSSYIITSKNERIESVIKLEKGKLISENGKTKTYAPDEVQRFTIEGINYISYTNDFYKETITGPKAVLYQKVSNNSGQKIYNGAEVIGFAQTTEGKIGDYYVRLANESRLDYINKKNFRNYFTRIFNNNDSMTVKLKNDEIGYDQVRELVTLYNKDQDTAVH